MWSTSLQNCTTVPRSGRERSAPAENVSLVVRLRSLVIRSPHAFPLFTIRSERMTRLPSAGRMAGFMRASPQIPSDCPEWVRRICLLAVVGALLPLSALAQPNGSGRVALDFNEVDLSVFVRFISELTGKNFVLDDTVKKAGGKISVFSPTKVTPDQAYHLFVSALEVSRLAVVPRGPVYQIVPMGELPPERDA